MIPTSSELHNVLWDLRRYQKGIFVKIKIRMNGFHFDDVDRRAFEWVVRGILKDQIK
jgi:hypothetical protein